MPASTPVSYPRREQRKQRTRAALIRAAHALFAELGYDNTTLEAVAARAEVHVQTLYRHFPTKVDLAIAPNLATFDAFCSAIRARPADQDSLDFWRNWVIGRAAQVTAAGEKDQFLQRLRFSRQEPIYAAALARLGDAYEDELTHALASDQGQAPDESPAPRLVAIMLWGANRHAQRRWLEANGKLDLVDEVGKAADSVIALVAEGHTW